MMSTRYRRVSARREKQARVGSDSRVLEGGCASERVQRRPLGS